MAPFKPLPSLTLLWLHEHRSGSWRSHGPAHEYGDIVLVVGHNLEGGRGETDPK